MKWLTARLPGVSLTDYHVTAPGVGSWYTLTHLQQDVIDRNPGLVIIDFAIDDKATPAEQAAAEGMVRRLRASLPRATLVATLLLWAQDVPKNDATNRYQATHDWWTLLATHYGITIVDFAAEIQRQVASGTPLSTYLVQDGMHPNDAGHALIASLLEKALATWTFPTTGLQWSGNLADYPVLNNRAEDYTQAPIVLSGASLQRSGSWVTANGCITGTVSAEVTFTGTFSSFGLDAVAGQTYGTLSWSVDGGPFKQVLMTRRSPPLNLRFLIWDGPRGQHSVVIRVTSGTIRIDRFLAV